MEFVPIIQAVTDDGDEALCAELTRLSDTRAVLTACSLRSPEGASRSDFDPDRPPLALYTCRFDGDRRLRMPEVEGCRGHCRIRVDPRRSGRVLAEHPHHDDDKRTAEPVTRCRCRSHPRQRRVPAGAPDPPRPRCAWGQGAGVGTLLRRPAWSEGNDSWAGRRSA